uniref:DUF834 domain-containing protein n=1 Tax=Oryza punctata TaxID=4537 RepID=A0A0E0LIG2_ORYPU
MRDAKWTSSFASRPIFASNSLPNPTHHRAAGAASAAAATTPRLPAPLGNVLAVAAARDYPKKSGQSSGGAAAARVSVVEEVNMDGHEQQWGKPRGEKRRRVGHDHHDGGAEHDDKDMDQRHRGEERGERCRRVGHGQQRRGQRGKSVECGAAAARVSVMEEVHMDGREQHWGEEREEKRRRVGRDHQDGGIEHDDKDRDQRHRCEERGERCRRVGHDHQGRE